MVESGGFSRECRADSGGLVRGPNRVASKRTSKRANRKGLGERNKSEELKGEVG